MSVSLLQKIKVGFCYNTWTLIALLQSGLGHHLRSLLHWTKLLVIKCWYLSFTLGSVIRVMTVWSSTTMLQAPGHSIIWLAPSSTIFVVRYSVQHWVQNKWPHSNPVNCIKLNTYLYQLMKFKIWTLYLSSFVLVRTSSKFHILEQNCFLIQVCCFLICLQLRRICKGRSPKRSIWDIGLS